MAHKLYFDNVGTSTSTLNDGILVEGFDEAPTGVMSFSDAGTLTNESRATDRDTINAITSWGSATGDNAEDRNDALQFDFGASKAIDFVALFFNAAETDSIRVSHDDAATGAVTLLSNLTADFTTQWNIRSFTQVSNRYWYVEATSGTLAGVTEIFFGTEFVLPIDGNSITTHVPFSSFIGNTYNNTEFTNKIDTDLREWTIAVPLITEANKTSLELLQSQYSNLHTFVYYDEASYHTVRLAKPMSFNQVATNTYSTTISLREEP
tara:strand:+ start:1004 stop:1798 length:795 start_codon:yes stop_codon:yes gene_type:complete